VPRVLSIFLVRVGCLEARNDDVGPEWTIREPAYSVDPPAYLARWAATKNPATTGVGNRGYQLGSGSISEADREDRVVDPKLSAQRGVQDRHA